MKLVVFVCGPEATGKSAISNHLAEISESLSSTEYKPTVGCRILEFERKLVADPKKNQKFKEAKVEVEVWDCSGNAQYLETWTSLSQTAHAVLFVVNPDAKQEKELDKYQECFPSLKPSQCAVFAHRAIGLTQKNKLKLTNKILSKSNIVFTSLDQDPDFLRGEFNDLLASAYGAALELKEKEENAISGR